MSCEQNKKIICVTCINKEREGRTTKGMAMNGNSFFYLFIENNFTPARCTIAPTISSWMRRLNANFCFVPNLRTISVLTSSCIRSSGYLHPQKNGGRENFGIEWDKLLFTWKLNLKKKIVFIIKKKLTVSGLSLQLRYIIFYRVFDEALL